MAPSTPNRKSQEQKSRDKYELSPNGRARCQKCRRKIQQGSKRVGIEEYSERYNKRIHRYYHDSCVSQSTKSRLRLGGTTPHDAIARQRKDSTAAAKLLQERRDLREALRGLRRGFSDRLRQPPFLIFHDTVLNEITVKMPSNKRELLAINGIAEKKYQSFGEPILYVVKHFRRLYARRARQRATQQQSSPAPKASAQQPTAVAVNDDVTAVETLSCEEIVKNKFEHAAANGYIISID